MAQLLQVEKPSLPASEPVKSTGKTVKRPAESESVSISVLSLFFL